MNILDQFREYGLFAGDKPEGLTERNLEVLIQQRGKEWVSGYLDAIQVVQANLSDIMYPEKVCGVAQTPHIVKRNLKEYWNHNRKLLLTVLPHIEPPSPKPSDG